MKTLITISICLISITLGAEVVVHTSNDCAHFYRSTIAKVTDAYQHAHLPHRHSKETIEKWAAWRREHPGWKQPRKLSLKETLDKFEWACVEIPTIPATGDVILDQLGPVLEPLIFEMPLVASPPSEKTAEFYGNEGWDTLPDKITEGGVGSDEVAYGGFPIFTPIWGGFSGGGNPHPQPPVSSGGSTPPVIIPPIIIGQPPITAPDSPDIPVIAPVPEVSTFLLTLTGMLGIVIQHKRSGSKMSQKEG